MKLQIFSDLHIDVAPIKTISIADGVDCVIVAGDTCEGALGAFEYLRRIVPVHIPIVMTLGNHEYYRGCIPEELMLARTRAPAFNIHVLENESVVLGGASADGRIRFVGASLWTDYRIFGEEKRSQVMNACGAAMNDHRLISWQKQPWLRFRPQEAAQLHHQSRVYIDSVLAVPFDGATVVVTHHAVHWNSILPKYRKDLVTGAFVSDMTATIEAYQPDLWVHGHVHNSSDYRIGGRTRVVCNAHGYGDENTNFDGSLVIEVSE